MGTTIFADISISLDGFVAGPNVGLRNGMGDGGDALHAWAFSDDPAEQQLLADATARSGAVIQGRTLFDIIDGPDGWSEEVGYGAEQVGKPPFVVVTRTPPATVRLSGLDWTFVTTGLEDAIATATTLARGGGDVVLMGGGELVGSAVSAGLVDSLVLHVAPVLLGSGTPLFTSGVPRTLRQVSAVATANATHLTYDVR